MPNVFSNKLKQAGLLIVGGLIVAGTTAGLNGLTSGGTSLPEVTSTGAESVKSFVASNEFNALIVGTGSTSLKYPAVCIANPLASIGQGSGAVVRLSLEVGNSPAGIGGDIGFVKSCGDGGGSGATLINDTCTATGCVSHYTTGTAIWNGADYIKFTPRGNLTTSYTARLRGTYEDIYGE